MNETSNQYSFSTITRTSCFALGLTLALVCQQSAGQSAPAPPKVPARVAELQAYLEKFKSLREDLNERLDVEQANQKTIEQELEEIKKRKSKLRVSVDSYPEILKTIQSQRVQLSIDLAGLEARYDAIAKAVDGAERKRKEDFLKPYKQLVDLRQAKLNRLIENKATTPKEKRDAAEVELLEAQLRLAEASKPSGALSHLNSQLLDTSLEQAEKTARLDKANSLFKDVEEYQTFRADLKRAESKRLKVIRKQQDISSQYRSNERDIENHEELLARYGS